MMIFKILNISFKTLSETLFHIDNRWNFHSKNGDIAFTVYYRNDKEGSEVSIVPRCRLGCDVIAIKDEIPCGKPGLCMTFRL